MKHASIHTQLSWKHQKICWNRILCNSKDAFTGWEIQGPIELYTCFHCISVCSLWKCVSVITLRSNSSLTHWNVFTYHLFAYCECPYWVIIFMLCNLCNIEFVLYATNLLHRRNLVTSMCRANAWLNHRLQVKTLSLHCHDNCHNYGGWRMP